MRQQLIHLNCLSKYCTTVNYSDSGKHQPPFISCLFYFFILNWISMEREDHVESGNVDLAEQPKTELKPGDVIWIKLSRSSWWPAQVADEKAVSDSLKPHKRKSGEVLVRLYGTYEYSYVDTMKRQAEFENVLKKHNGNQKEIFEKALAQFLDLPQSQSGGSKKQSGRATGVKKRATATQDEAKKKVRPDSPSTDMTPEKPPETPRRLRIMQGLGLTPPPGSPFIKNGRVLSIVD